LITLLDKVYDGESLYDVNRDVADAFDEDCNPSVVLVPTDEYGLHQGSFKVTITWSEDE